MLDKIDSNILEFSYYDDEPLHIIIQTIMELRYFKSPEEIVKRLHELYKKGYFSVSIVKEKISDEYVKLSNLEKKDLLEYVKKHKKDNFQKFPNDEYYFKTTAEAYKLVDQDKLEI